MHLSFYLLLKAEGKPVKGNPVIEYVSTPTSFFFVEKMKILEMN